MCNTVFFTYGEYMNVCLNPLLNTTFACELCGKYRTERTCWYKKRTNHYCSRTCANKAQAIERSSGLTKKEYQKEYWNKPENKERRKKIAKKALAKRLNGFGDYAKKSLWYSAKSRAKKNGREFNITINDFKMPLVCPVLNIPLVFNTGKSGGDFNSPTLDRIDSSLGYIKGNVVVISKRANIIKSDANYDELLMVAKWVKSFQPLNP